MIDNRGNTRKGFSDDVKTAICNLIKQAIEDRDVDRNLERGPDGKAADC